jgi:hypothetical protein
MFYYANPRPERFTEEVRREAREGRLSESDSALPLIVFLSQVMAANAPKVRSWLSALADLDLSARKPLLMAAWLSATSAGKEACQASGEVSFSTPPPDFLSLDVDQPVMLDALWHFYFATGDPRAIKRIATVFEYMGDVGTASSFRDSPRTDADAAAALRDAMFQAASWSFESLMRQHRPLKALCGELVRIGQLSANARVSLAMILAKIDPDVWQVDIDTESRHAEISWRGRAHSKDRGPRS